MRTWIRAGKLLAPVILSTQERPATFQRLKFVPAILIFLAAKSAAAALLPVPPRPAGPVYDGARVMRPADVAVIGSLSAALWEKARVAVVVATIPDLGGEPIEDVSIRIAKEWGIGGKENRGVLILAAINDRKARVEAGYGVEGYIPDGLAGEILDRDMIPRFRAGDMSGGVRAAVERVAALTAQEYGFTIEGLRAPPPLRGGNQVPRWVSMLIAVGVVLVLLALRGGGPLFWLLAGSALGRRGRYRGRGPFIGGGGFGGFGGGSFGGGGASRGW